jgi:hypothetical protein
MRIERHATADTDATSPAAPEIPPQKPEDRSLAVSRATDDLNDQSARLFAENNARPTGSTRTDATTTELEPRFNDGIIYLGMNSLGDQNAHEAANIPNVTVIAHSEDGASGADHVLLSGKVVDLATTDGAHAFAESLGLPKTQADAIASVLTGAHTGSRDELAGLARVFARAEQGKAIPSRLVLSGHCYGTSLWDGSPNNKEGTLTLASVSELAKAMPKAAGQIEDLMLSACSTGYDGEPDKMPLGDWKQCFPNLKTAWGYATDSDYHSPTGNHAISHITAWREATRGRATDVDGSRAVREAYARHGAEWGNTPAFAAENVSVWTASQGYRKGH